MRGALKLLSFLLLTPLASAQSPSFDCHNATTPREHAICTTPDLAALDTKLSAAYKSTLANLSPFASDEVRTDQREWLHWLDRVCAHPSFAGQTTADCLTTFYNERHKQLTNGLKKIDNALFYPRARFLFVAGDPHSTPPSPDDDPNFGYGEFSWPQIDNPTPAQRTWNQAVYNAAIKVAAGSNQRGKPTFDAAVDDTGYVTSDYVLTAANTRMISVDLIISTYNWGAAHPLSAQSFFTWWLDQQRPLKSTDVFGPGTPWQPRLATLTLAKLLKDPGPDALWKQGGELEKAVARGVINPKSWNLSSEGLTINFGSYEVGPYSTGWPSVTIPWQNLNPRLNPTTLPPPTRTSNP